MRDASVMGQYLKQCREKAKLSQAYVAERMGYGSPQFISNWERGISMPPMAAVPKLVKIVPTIKKDRVLDLYMQSTANLIRKRMGLKRGSNAGGE